MKSLIERVILMFAVIRTLFRRRPTKDVTTASEHEPEEAQTISYEAGTGPAWAEPVVAILLLATAAGSIAFIVLLILYPQTQLLALLLGGGLAALAVALVIAGSHVVPQEQTIEPRPPIANHEEQSAIASALVAGTDGISRRQLLGAAAGTAGVALGAAVIAVPLTQAGPGTDSLQTSPWKVGVALVAEDGSPINADDLEIGGFLTAFPQGADIRELGAPVVMVRVDPATIRPPQGRETWSPEGLLAFSKICTHAGCAVSLFRSPLDERHSAGPALTCPCHYSTFDVRRGAKVIFGPAGRPLPQLPLRIAADRTLVAAGGLSGSVGPAWWGTDRG